jgi:hypothetical protein
MALRMFNWLRHIRSRKDNEGKPEAQKAGRLEDSTTTPVGTPAPDAESSITDQSRLKTNPTTIEIKAIEATKIEEEHASSTPATATLTPTHAHAKTKSSPTHHAKDI